MTLRKLTVMAMIAAVALGAAGCQKDKGGKKAGSSLEAKFQGEWTMDFEKLAAGNARIAKLGAAQKKELADVFAKMVFKISQGTLEMSDPDGKSDKGTYTVKSSEGDRLVIDTRDSKGKAELMTVRFLSDDSIELSKPGDQDNTYLRRKK